jgi:hypothetical protein
MAASCRRPRNLHISGHPTYLSSEPGFPLFCPLGRVSTQIEELGRAQLDEMAAPLQYYFAERRVAAGASVPIVSSCGLGGGPPPRQFTLTPAKNFPRGLPLVKWSLVADEPTAARQIDTSRIAPMNGPFRVEYYADVEWTDNAPAMVQLLLIQSLQNTGRLPVVAPTRRPWRRISCCCRICENFRWRTMHRELRRQPSRLK